MNLFDLSNEYLQVLEMAEDPAVDPQAIADTMEAIEADIEDKADNYARIISQLNGDADALDAEIARLRARKQSIEGNADRLKKSLEEAMRRTGKVKFKTKLHSFGIQKNPPRCVIDNADEIPESFLVAQAPKIDSAGILKALKAGAVYNFAHLEQGESLRIR